MATAAAPPPSATSSDKKSGAPEPAAGDAAPVAKPRRGKFRLLAKPIPLIGILLVAIAVGWSIYYFLQRPGMPPESRLQLALQKLDANENEEAHSIAQKLEDSGFSPTDFPGGISF